MAGDAFRVTNMAGHKVHWDLQGGVPQVLAQNPGYNVQIKCDQGFGVFVSRVPFGATLLDNPAGTDAGGLTPPDGDKWCVGVELTEGSAWWPWQQGDALISHRTGVYTFSYRQPGYTSAKLFGPPGLAEYRGLAWAPVLTACEPGYYCTQ